MLLTSVYLGMTICHNNDIWNTHNVVVCCRLLFKWIQLIILLDDATESVPRDCCSLTETSLTVAHTTCPRYTWQQHVPLGTQRHSHLGCYKHGLRSRTAAHDWEGPKVGSLSRHQCAYGATEQRIVTVHSRCHRGMRRSGICLHWLCYSKPDFLICPQLF